MVKEFKKISVTKEVHNKLKQDREKYNFKSISETILYYINSLRGKK